MKSTDTLALLIVALCFLHCYCQPKRHVNHHRQEGFDWLENAPFLRNLPKAEQMNYFAILHNMNNTIAQKIQEVLAWARNNSIEPQVIEFNTNITKFRDALKQNITTLLNQLPSLYQNFVSIIENENQTIPQMVQAIQTFKNQSQQAFAVITCVGAQFIHPGRPGKGKFGGKFNGAMDNLRKKMFESNEKSEEITKAKLDAKAQLNLNGYDNNVVPASGTSG